MKPICTVILLLLIARPVFAQEQSANEKAVWKLEHSYWEYVKAADLERYRSLWHPNFVGWPSSSAMPARKNHITDWIARYQKKGLHLQSYTLQPAGSQATENVVVTHYWISDRWVDKKGIGQAEPSRITHTWI